MAFKGDSSQISIANIFQTLQLNGQEGVMTVSSGKVRRKIRLVPGGLRLISMGRENLDILKWVVVKQKIVTESQFQNIFSTMGGPSLFPGEFLIQRRILTAEQVENDVAKQLRELIFEIFTWKKAKYEFSTGDRGDEFELFNPAGLGQSLIFNISSILMEAARRDDEWQRIFQVVSSEREIYVPADPAKFLEARAYESEIDATAIQEVKQLMDGQHTIEAIVTESTLSAFEVFRVVVLLLGRKEIRRLATKEMRDLAEDLRKKFKTTEVVEIYRHLLQSEPGDTETRLKLVQLLERRKEASGLLLEQYQYLAQEAFVKSDFTLAMGFLKRIVEVDRNHLFALEKLFEIHYLQKNHKEAIEMGRRLVEAVKAKKEFERGTEILLKVVDVYPAETFIFHELADIFIFANQSDNAVSCLKSVASLYEERGDLVRLRKTYERIASIEPSEAATLRKIVDAERRTNRPRRSRTLSRELAVWGLAAIVLLGAAYLASMELLGRRAYATVRRDVQACIEAGDFEKARSILGDISRRYPLSTIPARINEEVQELTSQERERDAQLRKHQESENLKFGSTLARLESLMSGKRYMEALALIKQANRGVLSDVNRKKLITAENEIHRYFSAADELMAKAKDLIQANKHEEAHALYFQLMMNYPSTPATQGLRLPLLVRSTPPGARVVLNGEAAGTTPFTLFYDPLAKFSLSIQKEGFRSQQYGEEGRSIDFTKDWLVNARLERIPAWVFDAQAPVECTPVSIGNLLYFGTRGGRIYCLDLHKGEAEWSYSVPDGWDVASGIRIYRDRIAFGTYDGTFHVLEAKNGRPLHRVVPLTPARPIRHPSSEATEGGVVAVNCGGMAIAGINLASGTLLWLLRSETEFLGPPELHRGAILAATPDGAVQIIDPQKGTAVRRIMLGGRIQVWGRGVDGSYVAGDTTGRIRRVDLTTGAVLWTYESPMEELTAPAIGTDLVFFGSRNGLIAALSLKTGDLRFRGKINDALTSAALWHRSSFYLGTKGGQGLCLDSATGSAVWAFPTGSPLGSTPGSAGDLVLFGCDDHRVYAFHEN